MDGKYGGNRPKSSGPEVFYRKKQPTSLSTRQQRPISDYQVINNNNNNNERLGNDDNYNAIDDEDDPTLLRGTTVSQSFIKNIKNKRMTGKTLDNNNWSGASSTSNGFRRSDRLYGSNGNSRTATSQHKRHRSANELITPTDELEARYLEYNHSEPFDMRGSSKRQSFKPRTIDRAII